MEKSEKAMPRSSRKPTYPLEDLKELAIKGKFRSTLRVNCYIETRYPESDLRKVVAGVFKSLSEDDFVKSVELKNRPGTMADVYAGGWYDSEEWYVKAFIENETLTLQIWSMCWDGGNH